MPFHAVLSTASTLSTALAEVGDHLESQGVSQPDLAVVFFSPHFLPHSDQIADALQRQIAPGVLLGSLGESIIGNNREIEQLPALCVWTGKWTASVQMAPFHLTLEQTSEGHSILGWPDELDSVEPSQSLLLTLGDPYTFPADLYLQTVNRDYPGLRIIGGMASGSRGAGETRLLFQDKSVDRGAIGVLLQGLPSVRSIVSQGCRPVGSHMVVTKADRNLIIELGGRPALLQLQETWQGLTPHEQELFQKGPHVGCVMNEYQGEFQRGDFLVRNILGVDRESGAIAITDLVRVGQTVQFHIRDADTADEDLRALLQSEKSHQEKPPAGGLLFSCNGRGTRMFTEEHHDARVIRTELGEMPLAGFFAAGELGPVGGQNFIHGFTASLVLFDE